jgi:hypothetical protein
MMGKKDMNPERRINTKLKDTPDIRVSKSGKHRLCKQDIEVDEKHLGV